jgi:hypothetical protein
VPTVTAYYTALAALGCEPEAPDAALLAHGADGARVAWWRRELERCTAAAPARIEGVRLARLIAWDTHTSAWEGWDAQRAERVLARVARTEHGAAALSDAAARPGLLPMRRTAPGHLLSGPIRETLADAMPTGPTGFAWAARLASGVLVALRALHAAGHAHGAIVPEAVVCAHDGRWTLAWFGEHPRSTVAEDLRSTGRLLAALDPDDALGAAAFAEWPPPSAADAGLLIAAGLAVRLAAERHGVERRARALARSAALVRLVEAARRLHRASAPPVVRACLRVGSDGRAWIAESDGRSVRIAVRDPHGGEQLTVACDGGDVDAVAVRGALRAWSTRSTGDEPRRVALQGEFACDDDDARRLIRWLVAQARLRTDRLLLAREAR